MAGRGELFCLLWWHPEENIIPLKYLQKMILKQNTNYLCHEYRLEK